MFMQYTKNNKLQPQSKQKVSESLYELCIITIIIILC